MTNPITHILWGYVLTDRVTDEKKYLLLGSFMAILMDVDGAPISWLPHRGFVHTLPFALIVCLIVYGLLTISGRPDHRLILLITSMNLGFHLILDTIGSNWGIMWGYPISHNEITLGDHTSLPTMYAIKAVFLFIPCVVIWREHRETGKSPLDLYEYLKREIGVRLTNALILIFLTGVAVYYGWPLIS